MKALTNVILLVALIQPPFAGDQQHPSGKNPMAIWPPPLVKDIPIDQVRQELEVLYAHIGSAYVTARTTRDLEAIHQTVDAPDCRFIQIGQPARAWHDLEAEVATALQSHLKTLAYHIDGLDVDATNNLIIANVTIYTIAQIRVGPLGTTHEVETVGTAKDAWVKTSAARWLRRRHEQLTDDEIVSVDAKPLAR